MRPDHHEFADGVKLATIAVVSAVVTATLVIGAGRSLLPEAGAVAAEPAAMTRVAFR